MRLILFLGAGVSSPSHLPMARELTRDVRTRVYHQVGPRRFAEDASAIASTATDATPRIRGLLTLLAKHDRQDARFLGLHRQARGKRLESSGAIYRGPTAYEDLFHLCSQISLWNVGLVGDSLTTPLMRIIEQQAGPLLNGRSVNARLHDLASLGSLAVVLMATIIADRLQAKTIVGLDTVTELAKSSRIDRLDIVTLNPRHAGRAVPGDAWHTLR
jgi:hypothetical protein